MKEGYAKVKEEGVLKSMFWSEKYLVLREFQLDFLKSHSSPKVSFTIPLKDVLSITRSENYPYSFEISRAANTSNGASPPRDGPTKILICKVETDDDVYSWIDYIYNRCPNMGGVSNPTNFTHRVHVGFDPTSGAFVGLPVEWEKLLTASAITKDDYQKNPKAVLEVLEFYTEKLVKRNDDPASYPSLTPTPPISSGVEKQLGYSAGNSIAGPRPTPPNGYQRKDSYSAGRGDGRGQTPGLSEKSAGYGQYQDPRAEEERRRRKEEESRMQRERERQDRDRREREEQAAYNASLPQQRLPMAKQELGGYGDETSDPRSNDRYNPSRPAPSTPRQQQPQGQMRPQMTAQRPAPSAPTSQNGINAFPKPGQSKPAMSNQRPPQSGPQYKPQQPPQQRPPNGSASPQRAPGATAPKPLNVQPKQQQAGQVPDGVKKAEEALTAKKEDTRKDVRMSSMTESEVMAKLRTVVSKDKPLDSYNKQKKIGQGASGSVYVARIKETATSATARMLLRENGPRAQVAIKQMDLRNQPRKELIVNEIIVMKDSRHPNIVNFLDAFLQEEQSELWVVMEFMEGGALTDVIDNNASISEDQIATICLEVRARKLRAHLTSLLT